MENRCRNCGKELESGAKFCVNCGISTETSSTNSIIKNNPFPALFEKIKVFVIKNKKPVIISASVFTVLIIGIAVFNACFDFTRLEWDPEYSDLKLDYTSGRRVEAAVIAKDRGEDIDEVVFEVSNGEIEVDGVKATWTLPEESGEYSISAKIPNGKTVEKTIKRIAIEDETNHDYNGMDEEDVKNENVDFDMDGLIDYYETEVSKTDPKKADTDGDSILDGDEVALGLNPLLIDSKNDGVNDGDRELSYSFEENGVAVEINGRGNIASSSVDILKNASFKEIEGLLSDIYNISTSGKLKDAKVSIRYDESKLKEKGIKEEDLTLYYLNDETRELEKVDGNVDVSANTITAKLDHFSKYVLGNKTVESKVLAVDVMFVIDNSVSMYTEAQVFETGAKWVNGADGNDASFKRLSLSESLVEKMTGNFKFGVAEFSGNYVNLQEFTENKASAKSAIEKMRSKWSSNRNGTDISISMKSGVGEFSDDEAAHYMIFLTDGKDTSGSLESSKKTIINLAKEKNVKICTIGLGDQIDADILEEISDDTGCDYYSANDSNALDEIFDVIAANINYGYEDTDRDDSIDGMIVADSGFVVTRDGFSFRNYGSEKSVDGHCFGMATFAESRFIGKLPMKLGSRTERHRLGIDVYTADGYDLSGTYFAGSGNLYDFHFTTPALALFFDGDFPADYRDRVEDGTWMIKKEYYDMYEKTGFKIYIRDAKNSEKTDAIKKVQSAIVREDDPTFKANSTKDESGVIDAIWRLFIVQYSNSTTKRSSFNSEPDNAWNSLKTKLENGDPAVISINRNHGINAIKLIQDNNDPNKFKLAVYNNNYPGETHYIEITRKKMNKIALNYVNWTNDYSYKFSYDGNDDVPVTVFTPDLN